MRWIRANSRFGAWCALVAIALQITLTFGHAHRSEAMRPGLPSAAAAVHVAAVEAVVERQAPAQPEDGAAAEYCAICAVVELAATAVPPHVPASGPPEMTAAAAFVVAADSAPDTAHDRLFQARGPPQAS